MTPSDWLEEHALACPIKSATGINCPGCGMQRAFILLLRGEFVESVVMYPPLIPVIITLGVLGWHLVSRRPRGAFIVMWSFIVTMSIVTVSFVINQVGAHNEIHAHQIHGVK